MDKFSIIVVHLFKQVSKPVTTIRYFFSFSNKLRILRKLVCKTVFPKYQHSQGNKVGFHNYP